MIVFPNAKINIGLHVLEKRKDAYHDIESLFYPVQYCDILEIIEDKTQMKPLEFTFSGNTVAVKEGENLCEKAFQLIANEYDIHPVKMQLHKLIPTGAGLGGGSSDAAFVLQSLNRMFQLNIPETKLLHMASVLGSDCAFFVKNYACMAYGRGEILEASEISLKGYYIVIVTPDIHISTAVAYAGIVPRRPEVPLKELLKMPVEKWKEYIVNDFETGIFKKYPQILQIKNNLYERGALYASMSGSGSSVYGIFDFEPQFSTSGNEKLRILLSE